MTIINPHKLIIWTQKFVNRARGTKRYRAGFDLDSGYSNFSRRKFTKASDAVKYGHRVKARWCRLYDARILAMMGRTI